MNRLSWNGMFKRFNTRNTEVSSTVVTQRGVSAGGNVVGVRNDGDRKLLEQNEAVHAENQRLIAQIKKDWQHEYDRGYEDALKTAFSRIEERDGRVGKKQILSLIQDMQVTHREKH